MADTIYTIVAPSSFRDTDTPTVSINVGHLANVSSLKVCISLDGSTLTADSSPIIGWRTVPVDDSSYTFTFSSDEQIVLCNATPNSSFLPIYFKLHITFSKPNAHGLYESIDVAKSELAIDTRNPSFSCTYEDVNSTTIALTGDSSKFIRYYSNLSYELSNLIAYKGATIASCYVSCNEFRSSSTTGVIYGVTGGTLNTTVTDSRGTRSAIGRNLSMVWYVKLTSYLNVTAFTGEGNVTFDISGVYFNKSFGAKNNSLIVYYRKKENSGSYGSWVEVTPTITTNGYKATVSLSGLNYRNNYTFQARAVDALMDVSSVEQTVAGQPVFDWGKDDFNFNVPVTFQSGIDVTENANFQSDVIFEDSAEFQNTLTVVNRAFLEGGATISEDDSRINLRLNGNGLIVDANDNELLSRIAKYTSAGIDPDTTLDDLILTHNKTPNGGYFYIKTYFYAGRTTGNNRVQIGFPYRIASGAPCFRYYYSGSWSNWMRMQTTTTYSTSEQNTGDVWIDGKPIYRVVIPVAAKSANTQNVGVSAYSIETYITLRGMFYENEDYASGYVFPAPAASTNSSYMIQLEASSRTNVRIVTTSRTWKSGFLIIEYTKTTD